MIRRLFLDPTASHLIISTTLGENFYLNTQSRQPKPLSRLKGVSIESISWNPSQPTASTREILIGAGDGTIYETYIELSSEFYKREEKYLKVVYKAEGLVSGIWTDIVPGKADFRRVIVSTPGKLLHFIGRLGRYGHEGSGSTYAKLFESETPTIREDRSGVSSYVPTLAVSPESSETRPSNDSDIDRTFAWSTNEGVLHGPLLASLSAADPGSKLFSTAKMLSNASLAGSRANGSRLKSGAQSQGLLALSQWHVLQLLDNRIVATNRLNQSMVYNEVVLDNKQHALALAADLKKNTFWLFTSREIFEIVIRDETRDVWKIMLQEQRFEEATKYAKSAVQKDAVASASGDFLLEHKRFMEAAAVYGKSSKPFEQVALAFIDQGDKDALRKYLLTKLASLKKTSVMQRTMLASWLTEIYMSKLNSLDDMMNTKAKLAENNNAPKDIESQLLAVRREFQEFVRKNKDDLDRKTVYDIISSHGREEELLHFSTTIGDYNYVLAYWVQRENWTEALKALNKQTDPDLIYKYSSVLMSHVAMDFIDIMMRQANVDCQKLIPAFLNYNSLTPAPLNQNQAVRYLLYEINNRLSTESAIHNTLISIYASHPSKDETSLLTYLESQSSDTVSSSKLEMLQQLPYDADFALRLCIQYSRLRACVHIYTTMGQYVSAVELALHNGEIDLATDIAERPEHDPALRKKLWLAIARSVISSTPPQTSKAKTDATAAAATTDNKPPLSGGASIKTALSLLRRAPDNILRIEDLLPLFPDFVLVDAFKDEICAALQAYSSQIDHLRREMDDSARTSSRIKNDVAQLAGRWALIEPGESCAVCGVVLLERRFWVWGCGHGVHEVCAAQEIEQKGPKGVGRRARELRREAESGGGGGEGKREGSRRELDEIVGASCPLCGDLAVRMVDVGFVGEGEAKERAEWAI